MQPNTRSRWTTAVLILGALTAGMLLVQQPAQSYQAAPQKIKWEYHSVGVEANALTAKVIEMGAEGWEVFSIVASEKSLETGDGNPPRIITDRYEVTARRPARQ